MKKLLTVDDVLKIGIGKRTTIWKKVNEGTFPRPLRLGNKPNSPLRWKEEDIENYINGLGNTYGACARET